MELVSGLLALAASHAFKAMFRSHDGSPSTTGEISGATAALVLKTLLTAPQDTTERLARIEEKIDKLTAQLWTTEMGAGRDHLRIAAAEHREARDRRASIDRAREAFVRASHSAQSCEATVQAKVHVAACWLAEGSARDAIDTLADASETALRGIRASVRTFSRPDAAALEAKVRQDGDFGAKLRLKAIGGYASSPTSSLWHGPLGAIRTDARRERDALATLFNAVQALRSDLGDDPLLCQPILYFHTDEMAHGVGIARLAAVPCVPVFATSVASPDGEGGETSLAGAMVDGLGVTLGAFRVSGHRSPVDATGTVHVSEKRRHRTEVRVVFTRDYPTIRNMPREWPGVLERRQAGRSPRDDGSLTPPDATQPLTDLDPPFRKIVVEATTLVIDGRLDTAPEHMIVSVGHASGHDESDQTTTMFRFPTPPTPPPEGVRRLLGTGQKHLTVRDLRRWDRRA
ncbi:hypothetical protein ACIA8G_35215 [Lentzea sp. NPDC051213]|uniref:hypothetical protein n=1 Tax=Lentzea sp. NPDC051213 TaxID=3364126 RepID=UPI0037AAE976